MSVLNPRNRLVNFRLSEIEFERLKATCTRHGARSLSDFARTAVLRSLDEAPEPVPQSYDRLSGIDRKVITLEMRVEQLLRLVNAVESVSVRAPLPAPGGELRRA